MQTYKVEFAPAGSHEVFVWVTARDEDAAYRAALMILQKAPYTVSKRGTK